MQKSLKAEALRHLARREHSRAELRQKLAGGAESAEQLDALLDDLEARRLLSDSRFANQRVMSRAGRLGNARLSQELRQRGVADEAISDALAECDEESRRCQQVWAKKFGQAPQSREDVVKQQRFLLYRGFSAASIRQVLADARQAASAEGEADNTFDCPENDDLSHNAGSE